MRWSIAALVLALGVLTAPAAAAADRQVLDSCAATVPAGQPIALNPAAVTEPITSLLEPLDPLDVLTPAFRSVWAGEPPIALPAGSPGIPGTAVADAVLGRLGDLPVLAPVIDALGGPLRGRLAMTCGIAIVPRVAPAPPVAPAPQPPPARVQPAASAPPSTVAPPSSPGPATLLPDVASNGPAPPSGGPAPEAQRGGAPAAAEQDLVPLAVANVPAAAELPAPEPRRLGWLLTLAALLNLLVGTQLGRIWALRRFGAGRGSSGRSARPLDSVAKL